MTASAIGYDHIETWIKGYVGPIHRTVLHTITWIVLCVLVAQRLTPAALARAIPASEPGSGRSRLRRVQRWWQGPELDVGRVAPHLIQAALAQINTEEVLVALDTTRVGSWEIWQAGIVWAGHTLPLAWAVLPYPWPRGKFRQVTLTLVRQLQAAFPSGQRWILVADRGFPSAALFGQLHDGQTDWTVRLKLSDWIEVGGVVALVAEHLDAGRLRPGKRVAATIGRGTPHKPRVTAWVVVNQEVPAPPQHKRNPGTERERASRVKAHQRHLTHKGRRYAPPSARAQRYAQTWVVFTTAETTSDAVRQYAARMAIEETFRDWHHGWGLRQAAARLTSEQAVRRLVGIVCLAYRLQIELGRCFSQDAQGQVRRRQWTVTDRVSLFWCAQHLLTDPGADWSAWLALQWDHLSTPTPAHLPRAA